MSVKTKNELRESEMSKNVEKFVYDYNDLVERISFLQKAALGKEEISISLNIYLEETDEDEDFNIDINGIGKKIISMLLLGYETEIESKKSTMCKIEQLINSKVGKGGEVNKEEGEGNKERKHEKRLNSKRRKPNKN